MRAEIVRPGVHRNKCGKMKHTHYTHTHQAPTLNFILSFCRLCAGWNALIKFGFHSFCHVLYANLTRFGALYCVRVWVCMCMRPRRGWEIAYQFRFAIIFNFVLLWLCHWCPGARNENNFLYKRQIIIIVDFNFTCVLYHYSFACPDMAWVRETFFVVITHCVCSCASTLYNHSLKLNTIQCR